MRSIEAIAVSEGMLIKNARFNPRHTLLCGQAFRWRENGGGFEGIAHGRHIRIIEQGENVLLSPCPPEEFERWWRPYFDLDRDYGSIVSSLPEDDVLTAALKWSSGLRILAQEPFEALISFIVSQNNNIKRISGIVERICERYGQAIDGGWAFPDPSALACAEEDELKRLGTGYRASYIKRSSALVAEGFDLEVLKELPLAEARARLMTLPGVGPKVADCVLLFSLNHWDAFPVDVWIKRALKINYLGDKDGSGARAEIISKFGPQAGYAQQVLFYYHRENNIRE